tara:strand:+ start:771 stop:1283 length:513 start_codon:yes stop_codon:yes gene_type:complete
MTEKNIVLRDLRISYNGPFSIDSFMKSIDSWLDENGYEKEQKKYQEHITENGKDIELTIEGHKSYSKWIGGNLILKAKIHNLKETTVKKGKKNIRISKADILVNVEGLVISHITESYIHSRPVYLFFLTLVDKYIYNVWGGKHNGAVYSDGMSLHKHLRAFFSLQKYKFK